jgi:hypothetical protein
MFTRSVLAIWIAMASTVTAYAFCLFNCQPSAANARTVLENSLRQSLGDSPYVIRRFEKTNAQEGIAWGVRTYVIEYEVEVEFPKGHRVDCLPNASGQVGSAQCMSYMFQEMENPLRTARVGERKKMRGSSVFQKTEKGWLGQDGVLY